MKFDIPTKEKSIIKVIGVGGGGGNAVHYMFDQGINGVDFAVCNTDNQALRSNPIATKIGLGPNLTEGRGAGSKPEVGKEACIESIEEIKAFLEDNTKMLFITAGMGGGTGTGAAPIIAKVAKEMDILTVAIVTLPFSFEGAQRKKHAVEGVAELKKSVDSILVINNDRLLEIHSNLSLRKAFAFANDILSTAAKGIAEIITVHGIINVDFEDVNTVMRDSGVALMGFAEVGGEDRAKYAIEQAINSPLLKDNDIRGAQNILLNFSTSDEHEITMEEIKEITTYIEQEAGQGTNVIWGNCIDDSMEDKLRITLIATGFLEDLNPQKAKIVDREVIALDADEDTEGFIIESTDSGTPRVEFVPQNTTIRTERTVEAPAINNDSKKEYYKSRSRDAMNIRDFDDPKMLQMIEKEPAFDRYNIQLDDIDSESRSSFAPEEIVSIDFDDCKPTMNRKNRYVNREED